MLSSGNGRHRRPKQAPAAVVTVATAAATGVGIALPLISAGSAQAADATTWDKVAICETGGQWTANTGNGFFGGLALTQTTWDQYGGDKFAERPDIATRAQQITIAENVLGDLGPDAWPGCETGTGLLTDTSTPDVDPSSTPAPDPSGPTGILPGLGITTDPTTSTGTSTTTPTDPSGTPTTTPTDPGTPTTGTGGDDGTGTGTPTTSPTTGTPSSPATPSGPATTPSDPGSPSTGVGSVSGSGGKHARPYTPTTEDLVEQDLATRTEQFGTTAGTAQGGQSQQHGHGKSATGSVKVGYGDSLESIAAAHHVAGGWHQLYETNRKLIGNDPNLIEPGQTINLG